MSRGPFLEFFAKHSQEINKTNCLNICFFENDKVYSYLLRMPRIYEKEIPFSSLNANIIEMVLEMNCDLDLKKTDFSYLMLDPFYLKDIRTLDFNHLQISIITSKEELIGIAFAYLESDAESVKISNQDFLSLQKEIKIDHKKNYEQNIKNSLLDNLSINYCYHYDNQLITSSDVSPNLCEYNKFVYNGQEIYFKDKNQKNDLNVLSLSFINAHNFDKFTFVFLDFELETETLSFFDILKVHIKKFEQYDFKVYQVSASVFIILLNVIFSNEETRQLKNEFLKYRSIILKSDKEISKNTNLFNLAKYLDDQDITNFSFNEYNNYLQKIRKLNLLSSNNYLQFEKKKKIVNSLDGSILNEIYSYPPIHQDSYIGYEKFNLNSFNVLADLVKKQIAKQTITLTTSLLTKRKTYEKLKKSQNENLEFQIILHFDQIVFGDFEKIYNAIKKINELKIPMIFDSTLYLNNKTSCLIKFADYVFINNDEYLTLINNKEGINLALIDFFIKSNTKIIMATENIDDDFIHHLIYKLL